jgi:hypothetical protein
VQTQKKKNLSLFLSLSPSAPLEQQQQQNKNKYNKNLVPRIRSASVLWISDSSVTDGVLCHRDATSFDKSIRNWIQQASLVAELAEFLRQFPSDEDLFEVSFEICVAAAAAATDMLEAPRRYSSGCICRVWFL